MCSCDFNASKRHIAVAAAAISIAGSAQTKKDCDLTNLPKLLSELPNKYDDPNKNALNSSLITVDEECKTEETGHTEGTLMLKEADSKKYIFSVTIPLMIGSFKIIGKICPPSGKFDAIFQICFPILGCITVKSGTGVDSLVWGKHETFQVSLLLNNDNLHVELVVKEKYYRPLTIYSW